MIVTDETIAAYVDGELADEPRAALEAQLAADASLAARVEAQRRLRSRLSAAFDPVLAEPAPRDLLALIRGEAPLAAVVDLAARRKAGPTWGWPQGAAVAASLLVGVLFGAAFMRIAQPTAILSPAADGVTAAGPLARALDGQLASDQPAAAAVRVGLTFRDGDGRYCRTFATSHSGGLAGVACRAGGGWRVEASARAAPAPSGGMRTAAAETPPAVLAAVDAMIAGEPLDARQEAAARAAGWR